MYPSLEHDKPADPWPRQRTDTVWLEQGHPNQDPPPAAPPPPSLSEANGTPAQTWLAARSWNFSLSPAPGHGKGGRLAPSGPEKLLRTLPPPKRQEPGFQQPAGPCHRGAPHPVSVQSPIRAFSPLKEPCQSRLINRRPPGNHPVVPPGTTLASPSHPLV